MTPTSDFVGVDRYFESLLLTEDDVLKGALHASEAAGLPAIAVTPLQGAWLHITARSMGARRVLEIGTLGGYSTIWLARALPQAPEGLLLTLEASEKHAEVARANIAGAGLADVAEVLVGPASGTLEGMLSGERRVRGHGSAVRCAPFDLIFIDADKQGNPDYFRSAMRLSHPGTLIIVDNVVREGSVLRASSQDPADRGVRRLAEVVSAEVRAGRVRATVVQTVGAKPWDGMLMAVVERPAP